jgi:hypothetical protein
MSLFVVTASRLRDGTILWLGEGPAWVTHLAQAQTLGEPELAAALAFGAAEVRAQHVIGVYQVAVDVAESGLIPRSTREKIRANGPSVRPDLALSAAITGA